MELTKKKVSRSTTAAQLLPCLFLIMALATSCVAAGILTEDSKRLEVKSMATDELIVEMAVVCDKEFSDIFNQDREKVIEYLRVMFWDVHLRFKTLTRSNISFRVTSVTLIQSAEEQSFIESAREEVGNKVHMHKSFHEFKEWMYAKVESLPRFDIAMAVVSTSGGGILGVANLNGLCDIEHEKRKVGSVLLTTISENWNPASTLAHEIAHVLGAFHDSEQCEGEETESHFIMGSESAYKRHKGFFFSSCTDKAIAELIRVKGECLRQQDSSITPIIDTSTMSGITGEENKGLSMTEQCRILRNGFSSNANQSEHSCSFWSRCAVTSPKPTSLNLNLLEGTPCGERHRCFRGTCLQDGFQLANVVTGQCLTSRNNSVLDDMPKMSSCLKFPTPLDLLIVKDKGPLGRFLVTPYSSPEEEKNSDKCLMLDLNEETEEFNLTFAQCSYGNNSKWFGWQFNELENGEFQLTHRQLNKVCLRLSDNASQVVASRNCSKSDLGTRWRLLAENGTTISNPETMLRKYAKVENVEKSKKGNGTKDKKYKSIGRILLEMLIGFLIGSILFGFGLVCIHFLTKLIKKCRGYRLPA